MYFKFTIYVNFLVIGSPSQPRINRTDAKQKEIWKKTVDVVNIYVSDGHPSDEELALYLGVHYDYQVDIIWVL